MSIFSKEYWVCAVGELKKPRMLVFAAVLVALRVALQAFSIPIIPGQLYINFGFLVNALGSMVYGPVVAVISGAVSDTVGTILFPKGTYFFPYIFQEIAGSLIFALFLYKFANSVEKSLKIRTRHLILLILASAVMLILFCIYRELKKPGSIPLFSFIHNLI